MTATSRCSTSASTRLRTPPIQSRTCPELDSGHYRDYVEFTTDTTSRGRRLSAILVIDYRTRRPVWPMVAARRRRKERLENTKIQVIASGWAPGNGIFTVAWTARDQVSRM